MSQRTLFKCDKCGREWEVGPDCPQQVNIALYLNYGKDYPEDRRYYGGTCTRNQTWCRPCIDLSGVVAPRKKEEIPTQQLPTTEEVLTEMLERLGFKRGE